MTSKTEPEYNIKRTESHWLISYVAMAGPCEILVRCKDRSEAEHLASLSFSETRRIERKFSRYSTHNEIYAINHSNGKPVEVDEELARLIDYAEKCYHLSQGLFDITTGTLRKAWRFDGSSLHPNSRMINTLRKRIGWDKVRWNGRELSLQPGVEIDLGGIGKEYAVDTVAELVNQTSGAPLMVNFGGDIRAITAKDNPTPWIVGIENPDKENGAIGEIKLTNGGVATSGDVRRFCYVDGVRMGHILNPRTGWPVAEAPRSVTVLGRYCMEAGFLATLAMLHGPDAEKFLDNEDISYHCVW